MSAPDTDGDVTPSAADRLREQARRFDAMIERWEAEDVEDEPDWSVEDVGPLNLRTVRDET
ncbi:MAG: hypothetical protein VYE22_03705 [Myxococcota bacterium]|nr:hypothetical protein [Myxococcota bacterium]